MHRSNSKNALGTVTILLTLMLAACSGDGGGDSKPAATNGSSNTTGSTNTGGPRRPRRLRSVAFAQRRAEQAGNRESAVLVPPERETSCRRRRCGSGSRIHRTGALSIRRRARSREPRRISDVGVYRGVTVTVTAGTQMRALSFDVEVVQVGTNSIMISWLAPTENDDGTPLVNLAGYRIRYGQQSGLYNTMVNIDNPGLATYVINGLAAGTYYLVLSAVNMNGGESEYSNEAQVSLG